MVFAISSVYTSFYPSYQKFITPQQIKKVISSHSYLMLFKKWLEHNKKLAATAAWLVFPDRIDLLQYQHFV